MKSIKVGIIIGLTILAINMFTGLVKDMDSIVNKVDSTTNQVVHEMVQPDKMMNTVDKIASSSKLNKSSKIGLSSVSVTSFQ